VKVRRWRPLNHTHQRWKEEAKRGVVLGAGGPCNSVRLLKLKTKGGGEACKRKDLISPDPIPAKKKKKGWHQSEAERPGLRRMFHGGKV